jgi:hypothetical protein
MIFCTSQYFNTYKYRNTKRRERRLSTVDCLVNQAYLEKSKLSFFNRHQVLGRQLYYTFLFIQWSLGRHDIQHNNTHHNDTQHNDTHHNDTQHNDTQHNDTQHNDT